MDNFDKLVKNVLASKKDPAEYLSSFFVKEKLKDYAVPDGLNDDERHALETMFRSRKQIRRRAEAVLDLDPFCLEAFFVYFILSEDIYVYHSFRSYFAMASDYADLSERQKRNYLRIMDFYAEFLMDIRNITEAIKVQRMIMKLNGPKPETISRLSYMYALIEDDKEFYRLYLGSEFQAYDYLMLTVTLLKHDEEVKAREVMEEMLEKIEYADHLDHIWDLDQNDPKQKEFYQLVDECYDQLNSVYDFFGWVAEVKVKR